MLASILLLVCYLVMLFSMYFLIRNKRVCDFSRYVNNLVFINNLLAIRRHGEPRFDRKQFPSYSKILYSLKSIKSYHKWLWFMKQEFTEIDLNLLNDTYHNPEIYPTIQEALTEIDAYRIKYKG